MESKKGTTEETRMILRWMSDERRSCLDQFESSFSNRDYEEFSDIDHALIQMPSYNLSYDDTQAISHYSGLGYFSINRAAKGMWNYEDNGSIDRRRIFEDYVEELSTTISNNGKSIGNTKVYRGVPIKYFRIYGIRSIDELEALNGKYLLDKGFVNTSLVEEDSFFDRNPNNGINYNVKIEYLVPEEFTDGMCIVRDSAYKNESEYLINTWNLAQVVGVERIGSDKAKVTALLVPKRVYDDAYAMREGNVK